ncbi:hypothetical protein MLD38_036011 [Melastoma candidum]|uniref:Uncharacterized protein n=1 Tax=Melastoma candidum TaxID=119954 RepID=A0ACB9LIB6_9MYRT|nr:hypothetical protein MLD38_036011 [Melastoma candidum]
MSLFASCWNSPGRDIDHSYDGRRGSSNRSPGNGRRLTSLYKEGKDGLSLCQDLGKCGSGEFSVAVVQANQVLEDQCQLESGDFGTFVGVYDGHGGPDASRYVCDNLFRNFQAISAEMEGTVNGETIRRAFLETEEGFISLVSQSWMSQPAIASSGSCCLVGVIHQKTLYIASLGDSRVVLGKKVGNTDGIAAIQLSTEHNANLESVRHELKELHPDDPQIVVLRHGVWRIKGIIQVSHSVGDVYLKRSEFNREPLNPKFRLREPFDAPILSADPVITSHAIQPNDCFLIFASDGLWEHLTNEQAVEIVQSHSPVGIAKRLVKAALQEAARKREMRYSDLRKIDKKVLRHFHDDITVIVLFLNHDLLTRGCVQYPPPVSIRSAAEQ